MKIFRISSLSIWPFYSASGRLFSIWPFEHLAVLFSISTRESGIWSFYSASGRFIQHLDTRIWHLVVLFSIWSFYSASGQKNLASGRFIQHLVVLFSIWTKEFGIWPFYSASRCQKRIWHLAVLFSISISALLKLYSASRLYSGSGFGEIFSIWSLAP